MKHDNQPSTYTDLDECLTNNGGCKQICTNTDGSFECSCADGYVIAADNFDCSGKRSNPVFFKVNSLLYADVNECQTSNGGCNQTCTNTDGSFECACKTGYALAEDNLGCNGKRKR